MESEQPLSQPMDNFKSHVSSTSTKVSALLQTLEKVNKPVEYIQGLSNDLETFHYSLVILCYHLLEEKQRYEDWCDVSRITALLKSAEQCFDRIHTLLLNSSRSDFNSVKRWLQASRTEGEMKHLRLRLTIYTTALSNPILMSAVHAVHLSLGAHFRALAFKAVDDWIHHLTQETGLLASDPFLTTRTQDSSTNRLSSGRLSLSIISPEEECESHPALRAERKELIVLLQAMIGTAMRMVRRSQRADIETQRKERDAVELGVPSTSEPTTTSSAFLIEHAFDKNTDSSRNDTHKRSSSRVRPPAIDPNSIPTKLPPIPPPDFSSTYDPNDPTISIRQHYTNAESLLALGRPLSALQQLEHVNALFASLPPPSPSAPPAPPLIPSPSDALMLTARTCLLPSVKRITRARQALLDIYTLPSTTPPARRYDAAHMLAKLYMFVDGDPDDPTIDWDGMSMNFDKAVEYVVAAVQGRKRLLGMRDPDTHKSVELLTTLYERAEGGGKTVPEELTEVLRETFEGSDDAGGLG